MFANSYKINLSTIPSGSTATTITIPIATDFHIVDQAEIVERQFVDVQVENAINPIIDYEKVRFTPLNFSGQTHIDEIAYTLTISGLTKFADIGFTDDDIKFEKKNFIETFLYLGFYDTDNPFTQKLVSYITLFTEIQSMYLYPDYGTQIQNFGSLQGTPGQPISSSLIPIEFTLDSPILQPRGFAEGYYLYDYKDELKIGDFKYLYMRASLKNAKSGTTTNLMIQLSADTIDNLVHKIYTRYKLIRTNTGYFYEIDDTYHGDGTVGPNNVLYQTATKVKVNLYSIAAL